VSFTLWRSWIRDSKRSTGGSGAAAATPSMPRAVGATPACPLPSAALGVTMPGYVPSSATAVDDAASPPLPVCGSAHLLRVTLLIVPVCRRCRTTS